MPIQSKNILNILYPCFCMVMLCLIFNVVNITPVQAQNSYQNLILSDDHTQHYLSPYLLKYPETENILNAYDVLTKKELKREVLNDTSSILVFKINEETTWFSFDVINRSSENNWAVQLGNQYEGRFGLFDAVTIYSFDRQTSKIKEHNFTSGNNLNIELPKNQKTRILLKFEKAKGTPISTPLYLTNSSTVLEKNIFNTENIISIFFIGMAFFFIAAALIKYNLGYLFFSAYYMVLCALLYIQNNNSYFKTSFINGEIIAYIFFAISAIAPHINPYILGG